RVPIQYLGIAENHYDGQINAGFSDYNSLQTTVLHRFQNGLYFQGAYTYSKCIDNGSGSSFQDELNGLVFFGDETNTHGGQVGLCDFDRTHRLSTSWNYDLPLGRWFNIANHGLGKAINGWTVIGVLTWQSGTPFAVYDASVGTLTDVNQNNGAQFATFAPGATRATALTSTSTCRVGSVDCFINLDAFNVGGNCVNNQNQVVAASDPSCTGLQANGNVPRNIFRGPRQSNIDFSLAKMTKLTERVGLQLRWEVFNLFNHPAFQSPQAGGAQFGNYGLIDVENGNSKIIGTANRPRIMQFAAKISF
ncbi:MAG: outer membrane beta-barrel protein, partial [Terriglobales bacterium]